MLYPSAFQFGIPGYWNPVAYPYEIVRLPLTMLESVAASVLVASNRGFRHLRDYAFDRHQFSAVQIRAQIGAAEGFGSDGWRWWDPGNIYTKAGLTLRQHHHLAEVSKKSLPSVSLASGKRNTIN